MSAFPYFFTDVLIEGDNVVFIGKNKGQIELDAQDAKLVLCAENEGLALTSEEFRDKVFLALQRKGEQEMA